MDYYSKIASAYDELYGSEQLEKLGVMKDKVGSPGLVLDVGSGTGLSRHFFDNLVQLDPSLGLLGKSSGLRVCGVAEFLPFKDKVFDAVISATALHHTKFEKAASEISRVSKPSASLAFSVLKRSKNFSRIVSFLEKRFGLEKEYLEKDLVLFKHVE